MVFFNVLVFLPIFSTNQRTPRKYSVVAIMNILQKKNGTLRRSKMSIKSTLNVCTTSVN